jgi:predicted NUDIX family NTP pyrophosphohydrolase
MATESQEDKLNAELEAKESVSPETRRANLRIALEIILEIRKGLGDPDNLSTGWTYGPNTFGEGDTTSGFVLQQYCGGPYAINFDGGSWSCPSQAVTGPNRPLTNIGAIMASHWVLAKRPCTCLLGRAGAPGHKCELPQYDIVEWKGQKLPEVTWPQRRYPRMSGPDRNAWWGFVQSRPSAEQAPFIKHLKKWNL